MIKTKKSLLTLILVILIFPAFAQIKTTSLSIFKNGKSFVVKNGQVSTIKGIYKFEKDLPQALYGSLWFMADNLSYVNAYQDSIKNKTKPFTSSYIQNILVNADKKCTLQLVKEEKIYVGKFAPLNINLEKDFSVLTQNLLLTFVTEENQWLQFTEKQIKNILFHEQPELQFPTSEIKVKDILELGFSGSANKQDLKMFYLSNGFSWHPFYLLELTSENKAKLIMNAEIVNNEEDLENISLNLIIGQPNLSQANGLTPLIQFNNPIYRADEFAIPQRYRNVLGYAAKESYAVDDKDMSYNNEITSTVAEDFHLFKLENITLPKGGRSQHKIFSSDIDIEHYYTVNINQNNASNYFYERSIKEQEKDKFIATHYLRTINKSVNPWTTAPVFVVENNEDVLNPISQDIIYYTSVKNTSEIKIAETPDIFVEHKEEVTIREKQSYKYNKVFYDKIEVEGTITIFNYKKTDRAIEINRTLIGQPVSSEKDWEINKNFPNGPNETNVVKWNIKTKKNEKTVFSYKYQLYVN